MHGNFGWIHDLKFLGATLNWFGVYGIFYCIYPGKIGFYDPFLGWETFVIVVYIDEPRRGNENEIMRDSS